jgi:hypothetical protein
VAIVEGEDRLARRNPPSRDVDVLVRRDETHPGGRQRCVGGVQQRGQRLEVV